MKAVDTLIPVELNNAIGLTSNKFNLRFKTFHGNFQAYGFFPYEIPISSYFLKITDISIQALKIQN